MATIKTLNALVDGLVERDYQLNKSVDDLTDGEKAMYHELAEKSNYQPEDSAYDLGCAFYLTLQPIYKAMVK